MEAATKENAIVRDKLFIGGAWTRPAGSGLIDVFNSTTEDVMGRVPEGSPEDVDKAVAAAKAAFPGWSQAAPAERAKYLGAAAEKLKERQNEIALLIANEVGMPLPLATAVQAGMPVANMAFYAALAAEYKFEDEPVGNATVVREPVGVVGCITPWNFPLHQVVAKIGPALAVGCTVVLKPSEVAPLTSFLLAEFFEEVGLPAGVFNLVTGYGPVVGEALAAHKDVDMVCRSRVRHAQASASASLQRRPSSAWHSSSAANQQTSFSMMPSSRRL